MSSLSVHLLICSDTDDTLHVMEQWNLSLTQTPMGQKKGSILVRCPYFKLYARTVLGERLLISDSRATHKSATIVSVFHTRNSTGGMQVSFHTERRVSLELVFLAHVFVLPGDRVVVALDTIITNFDTPCSLIDIERGEQK